MALSPHISPADAVHSSFLKARHRKAFHLPFYRLAGAHRLCNRIWYCFGRRGVADHRRDFSQNALMLCGSRELAVALSVGSMPFLVFCRVSRWPQRTYFTLPPLQYIVNEEY